MSQLYQRLGALQSDKPAIIEDNVQWTGQVLLEKVKRLASVLSQKGLQPGDRVALMFLNQKEFLLSFLALRYMGAVPVPINIQMPPDDILYVILNSGSKLVLTTDAFAPRFEGKPIPVLVANSTTPGKYPSFEDAIEGGDPNFTPTHTHTPNEMHVLMYTSGTTGKPKGVMLSEENLLANLDGVAKILDVDANERMLLALPLFHAYGLMIALVALDGGAPIVLVPNFSPKKIVEMVATHQVTILPLVPTMFTVLLKAAEKSGAGVFKTLKLCVSGGASLPKALLKQVEDLLDVVVLEGYGLTETAPVLAVNNPKTGSIPGSVGRPLANVELKLVNDAGEKLPETTESEGEILARGANIMLGYYGLPEETKAVFDGDGFFKTGDIGRFDESGNLYISGGRKKDLIIKAGENISPLRIEEVLYQHPAVREASVIGLPDDRLGEEVLACVELEEGHRHIDVKDMEKSLKDFCLAQLTPFLCPAQFRFFDELPKNPTGKIVKKELKAQVLSSLTTSAHS